MKRVVPPILVLLLSLVVVLPLFHTGFFPMHDDTQPTRVYEMAQSLRDGMFPVRWVKDMGFGYGYPIFNFYGPLPYYLGAKYVLMGINVLTATKIMMALPAVIGGLGMYFLVSSFLGIEAGIASATIYLFFPYFAVNMYVRGAVGEYFAYGFLPYILWGILKLYYLSKTHSILELRKWILLASVSTTLLIISHNLSAFMLIFLLFFILVLSFAAHPQKKRLFGVYFAVFLVAFLLSGFYALPALLEMGFTNVRSQVGGGADFHNHFVCLSQLWTSPWGFGGSAPGCLDGLSFELGKNTIFFSVLGILIFLVLRFRRGRREMRFLFLSSLLLGTLSLFMTTGYSLIIWNNLPFIAFLQYPWRFLEFAGISLAILSGFLIFGAQRLLPRYTGIIVLMFLVVTTLFLNAKHFRPQFYEARTAGFYTRYSRVSYDISKISHEYMPQHFAIPKNASEVPKQIVSPVRNITTVTIHKQKTGMISADITGKQNGLVLLNLAYFPAWHVTIDGKDAGFEKTNRGLLVQVPQGRHTLTARFRQTPVEMIADALSLSGVALIIAGIIYPLWKKQKK